MFKIRFIRVQRAYSTKTYYRFLNLKKNTQKYVKIVNGSVIDFFKDRGGLLNCYV